MVISITINAAADAADAADAAADDDDVTTTFTYINTTIMPTNTFHLWIVQAADVGKRGVGRRRCRWGMGRRSAEWRWGEGQTEKTSMGCSSSTAATTAATTTTTTTTTRIWRESRNVAARQVAPKYVNEEGAQRWQRVGAVGARGVRLLISQVRVGRGVCVRGDLRHAYYRFEYLSAPLLRAWAWAATPYRQNTFYLRVMFPRRYTACRCCCYQAHSRRRWHLLCALPRSPLPHRRHLLSA